MKPSLSPYDVRIGAAVTCGIPTDLKITSVRREADDVVLEWWDDPVASHCAVHRSFDAASGEAFENVTHLDDDDTDATFRDPTEASFACWIIQGIGPDGDGPWGHFGW